MKKIILSFTLLLIVHCTLNIEYCVCQWFPLPQFPTYLEVTNVKFFDENTGVLTIVNQTTPPPGIFRTTSGGQNWAQIKFCSTYGVQKIDSSTVYIAAYKSGYCFIYRTYDKGQTWDSVAYSWNVYRGISFVNRDTGWVSGFDGNYYCTWRTNDGGRNLFYQSIEAGRGEVFFLKQKVNGEYIGWVNNNSALWKTTNSGNNWFQVACPGTDLSQITFVDENIGWASNGNMYKTTNGGFNWTQQQLSPGIQNLDRTLGKFVVINKDTLFGVGGLRYLPNSKIQALVWKTMSGGTVWGYQNIDTSYNIGVLGAIDFINNLTGFAFQGYGVKTTNGGGSVTSINGEELNINSFKLFQNYPNPFNSSTNIKYDLNKAGYVKIQIFDITGKTISLIVEKYHTAGTYTIKFNPESLPSGIYFYRLLINDNTIDTKKLILLK